MPKTIWMNTTALVRACAISAFATAAVLAAPAGAQDTGAQNTGAQDAGAAAPDAEPAQTQERPGLLPDRIVVTARKREELVTDVPASVSSLSAATLDNLLLDNVADVVGQIPGGILVASGPSYLNDVALRGQGGGRIGFSESTTGIYRDGIYVAGGGFGGRSFSRIDFFDVNAIEVYRGPQGALYGRNAVGGAVNVISRRPTDELSGWLKFKYGTNERAEIEAVFNTPLAQDAVNLRIGGYYTDQAEGFYHVDGTGEVLDHEEEWGVRGALALTLGPDTDALLTLEHSHSDAPGFASLGRNLSLDTDPFTRVGLSDFDRVLIDQTSFVAELTHAFDGADLTVLANYKQRDGERLNGDLDHFLGFNSPLLRLLDEQGEEFDRHGVEARLASRGEGPLTWLVGADYQAYQSQVYSHREGSLAGPFAASAALRRQFRTDMYVEDLTSYSVFGLVGYDVNERTNVTFELRAQMDEKDFLFERVDHDPFTDEEIAGISGMQAMRDRVMASGIKNPTEIGRAHV